MWYKFKSLSVIGKALVIFGALFVLGAVGNLASPNKNSIGTGATVLPTKTQDATQFSTVKAVNSQTKSETITKPVTFTNTDVDDSSLASGTSKITVTGINGLETITYKVTYTDGVETNREVVSDATTTAPVNQITHIGTYLAPAAPSCPNGTYVNTYGNTVCSPYSSPTPPSGATAQCVDSTYSFSQSRRGTCSHHGGVSTWL